MSEIIVRYGQTTQLAKKCNCTIQSVRMALKGITDSELADRIRSEAIEMGGIEVQVKKFKPMNAKRGK